MRIKGFDWKLAGQRIDNIPDSGTLTGNWFEDLYGIWWEYKLDKPEISKTWGICELAYIIGKCPSNY